MLNKIIKSYKEKKRISQIQKKWRDKNSNNFTTLGSLSCINNVEVKNYTYGKINCMCYGNGDLPKLYIGNFCSIAPDVMFLLNSDHHTDFVSSYPFASKLNLETEVQDIPYKGDIKIDDGVWIGYGATILSGVHIGQGAVIGAGCLVSKDVPPYAIMGGTNESYQIQIQ